MCASVVPRAGGVSRNEAERAPVYIVCAAERMYAGQAVPRASAPLRPCCCPRRRGQSLAKAAPLARWSTAGQGRRQADEPSRRMRYCSGGVTEQAAGTAGGPQPACTYARTHLLVGLAAAAPAGAALLHPKPACACAWQRGRARLGTGAVQRELDKGAGRGEGPGAGGRGMWGAAGLRSRGVGQEWRLAATSLAVPARASVQKAAGDMRGQEQRALTRARPSNRPARWRARA
jgi:hypothetical protein